MSVVDAPEKRNGKGGKFSKTWKLLLFNALAILRTKLRNTTFRTETRIQIWAVHFVMFSWCAILLGSFICHRSSCWASQDTICTYSTFPNKNRPYSILSDSRADGSSGVVPRFSPGSDSLVFLVDLIFPARICENMHTYILLKSILRIHGTRDGNWVSQSIAPFW